MKVLATTIAFALAIGATPALAELQKIDSRADFLALVDGKTLVRPLVRLKVKPDGSISGKGAAWDVTGQWQWKSGYLCRSLNWGGDDLEYNCQEVKSNGDKMRITSDRGTGMTALFRLR